MPGFVKPQLATMRLSRIATKPSVSLTLRARNPLFGLWRGGSAGYGLRRRLIDPNGSPITQLEHGQRKAISSDRVILRPGPSTETKIVKRIFNSLVSGRTFSEIANDLNGDNIRNGRARPWSTQTIIKIHENEAYIGSAVYNRTSFKLREKAVINPPEMWIRRPNAYQPVIPF
jgi:recombinase